LGAIDRYGCNRAFLVAAVVIIAVILYGSLYPFTFHQPAGGAGPVRALLDSRAQAPRRGDFLANMIFYSPLGIERL
jgi:hypothetical protein